MFEIKDLKTLLEVIDRRRCIVCADLASGSRIMNIPYPDQDNQSQKEQFFFCCRAHEEIVYDLLKRWN